MKLSSIPNNLRRLEEIEICEHLAQLLRLAGFEEMPNRFTVLVTGWLRIVLDGRKWEESISFDHLAFYGFNGCGTFESRMREIKTIWQNTVTVDVTTDDTTRTIKVTLMLKVADEVDERKCGAKILLLLGPNIYFIPSKNRNIVDLLLIAERNGKDPAEMIALLAAEGARSIDRHSPAFLESIGETNNQ